MTSKQRAYLKGLAMNIDPILNIGKSSLTPEFTQSVNEALEARELVKISVLKNCLDDPREMASMIAERTKSEVVQVIGRKIVFYRPSKDMKIGILGGSFNPVHNGHLELAKQALAQFALDQIWLMPNHIPAYKKWDRSVTNEDRLHMVELAVKDHDGLRCSDLELQRGGVTYTIDTLAQLHEQYPDTEWYFIMGGDSILAFDTWREPDMILSLSKLIVTTRDQIQAEDVDAKIRHLKKLYAEADIRQMQIHPVDVSSSGIREAIKNGQDISGAVPMAVCRYIKEYGLYQTDENLDQQTNN